MELSTRQYQEKRNFIRMRLDCPALLHIDDRALKGLCSNLSGGGMLLIVDERIEVGSECAVNISSHFGHGPMLKARTRVIRALGSSDNKYHLGLAIIELLDH
jgi:hypothetical protein